MSTYFLYNFNNIDGSDQFIPTETEQRSQEGVKSSQSQWLAGSLWADLSIEEESENKSLPM